MKALSSQPQLFATEKISRILLKIAPPVMLSQLIQALYNIVDSVFVGRYSDSGLTALSIIYPMQLLMIALAVGSGVGLNTAMSALFGSGKEERAYEMAGVGTSLALGLWGLFAAGSFFLMPAYANMSTESAVVAADVVAYGRIVGVCSVALFLESMWTKVLQSQGDMRTPMIAQVLGAVVNMALDPILIFGLLGVPELGISGAALATVLGQVAAAAVVFRGGHKKAPARRKFRPFIARIFHLGSPNILMQCTYTIYIFGLNMILAAFCDEAVTTLGLYYKWQTFFFIPLGAMQTCIVPIVSFNYAARNIPRCKKILSTATIFGMALMAVGMGCFMTIPGPMLRFFSSDELVISIGLWAFPLIGLSFVPMSVAQIYPVFFQAVGLGVRSCALTVLRTVVLFVPLGYLFSRAGLKWFWLTFPVTEVLTAAAGIYLYSKFVQRPYVKDAPIARPGGAAVIQPSHPGVILTIAREHGSSGKEIGRLVAQALDIPFYYKEMTALAAQESGLDREFISNLNKNAPKVLYDLYLSTKVVQHAVVAQHKVIDKIAQQGSCVIVGRSADHVLKNHPDVVRLFLYAPEEYRISRVMEVYGDTREEARLNIRRGDKARAAYYRSVSGKRWGDRRQYDLMIDTSVGVQESAQVILQYLEGLDKGVKKP